MDIAISTLAFIGKTAEHIIALAEENNLAIEFSSGMPYRADMETIFLNASIKRYAHNYFPAPQTPFVLNLASSNETIRNTSIQHCIKGMELSAKAGVPFFSAHAGFCVDPKPAELGQELSRIANIDRELHWNLFIDAVKIILKETEHLKIGFLIENNVLAKMNVYEDGTNPLLCVEPDEIHELIIDINNKRLGILLDTVHLKVSATTLGFDKDEAVESLQPLIKCIHHSDNEGEFDNNEEIKSDYWFIKHLPQFQHILHVLEVKKIGIDEVLKQFKLIQPPQTSH